MDDPALQAGLFRCPRCRADWGEATRCAECGFELRFIDGVPILVADSEAVDAAIAEAKTQERAAWYEAPQYEATSGPYRHHGRKRRAFLDATIARHAAVNGPVVRGLDLGCGDGAQLPWLAEKVQELYGSDYNLLRLRRATRAGAARSIFMADVTNYPVRDDAFGLIFFNHVLEHIGDDAAALSEVRRVLKPGGLLILGVPNEGAWFWRLAYRLQPAIRRASDHVHFFTAPELIAKCCAAGFAIEHVEHIGWGVPHWSLDEWLRSSAAVDDALEWLGRRMFPQQATSLYLLLSKRP